MPTSSIDDLLMGGQSTEVSEEPIQEENTGTKEVDDTTDSEGNFDYATGEEESESHENSFDDEESDSEDETQSHEDEYGNKKELMSKNMQKRLKKIDEDHKAQINTYQSEIAALKAQLAQQGASKEMQQAVQDFEYDPNDEAGWKDQLANFVRQTIAHDEKVKIEKQRQEEEQQEFQEFRGRFEKGMNRFDDFLEVVGEHPIDSAMTAALRSIQDPAAFLYAVAKRSPQELERISKLKSPHQRHAEIIRLEERMRKTKTPTKAPRPLGRAQDDASIPESKNKKEETIEDLIAKSDAKKLAQMRSRQGYRGR